MAKAVVPGRAARLQPSLTAKQHCTYLLEGFFPIFANRSWKLSLHSATLLGGMSKHVLQQFCSAVNFNMIKKRGAMIRVSWECNELHGRKYFFTH